MSVDTSRESDSALDLDSEDLEEDTDSDDTVTDDPTTSDDNMDALVTDSGRASPDRDVPDPEGATWQHGKDEIDVHFLETGTAIFAKLHQLENEMNLLKVSKDKAVSDIDAYFDHMVHVLNRRRQLLKGEVMGSYESRVEHLEETQEKVTLTSMCLATLKKHAEEMVAKSTDKTVRRVKEMILPRIQEHRMEAENLGIWHNFLEFDAPPRRDLEKTLRRLGQVRSISCLPSRVELKQARYKLLNPSEVVLQISGFSGQPIEPMLVERKAVEVSILDPRGESVPCRVKHDCGVWAVTFTPTTSGPHELAVELLGEDVARLTLKIPRSRPMGLIGMENNFKSLNGIAVGEEGDVFLTDVGINFLYRFSAIGELKCKCDFSTFGLICFDIAWSSEKNMLVCSVNEISAESNDEASAEKEKERAKGDGAIKDVRTRMVEMEDGTKCLCMMQKAFVGLVKDDENEDDAPLLVILSDPNKNTVSVHGWEGDHIADLNIAGLDCPAFVAYTSIPQRSILIAESGKSLIRRCRYSSSDNAEIEPLGKHSLASCVGIATDEQGIILAADSTGSCIQLFNHKNNCIGTLDAAPGPGMDFHPWSIALTKSGHVWVVDKHSQTVQKYQYREKK